MKRVVISFVVLMAVIPCAAMAENPVYFGDANLKAAVEQALGKTNPTPTDMRGLDSLTASHKGIVSLTGLECATSLQFLDLGYNQISDLSPLSLLSGPTPLQFLYLYCNQISNLSPLSGLTNLSFLGLSYNQISDISALSGLTHLYQLHLGDNQISNLSPLSGLTNLYTLDLSNNQVIDFSPLSSLTSLVTIDLSYNQISDISALSGLTHLRNLFLSNNQISNLSPISSLTNLQTLSLNDNEVSDISMLVGSMSLQAVYLQQNPLNANAYNIYIPQLIQRGVYVYYDPPSGQKPTVSTQSAISVGQASATLCGSVTNDGGQACQYRFRYKKSGGSYSYTSWTGSVTTSQSFNESISGLTANSTYYCTAQAKNSAGESEGSEQSFTTLSAGPVIPYVSTYDARNITNTSAVMQGGLVDDGGEACEYRFRYWASGQSEKNTAWTGSLHSGDTFAEQVKDLTPGTPYSFEAQARNSKGQASGGTRSLTTETSVKPNPPTGLIQLKSDGGSLIAVGSSTDEPTVVFKAMLSDSDGDKVKLQVELRKVDEYGGRFLGRCTQESPLGTDGVFAVPAYGLVNAVYHWRARTVDEKGLASDWMSYGGNPDSDADLSVLINEVPIARFTYSPKEPMVGQQLAFDASASTDPDGGGLVSYQWDFGNGVQTWTTQSQITYTYPEVGDYRVILTVTDDEGSKSQFAVTAALMSGQIKKDIERLVSRTNMRLDEILDKTRLTAQATDYFAKEVEFGSIEIVFKLATAAFLKYKLPTNPNWSLNSSEYEQLARISPELANVIEKHGLTIAELTKTQMSFLMNETMDGLAGELKARFLAGQNSIEQTFVPDLESDVGIRKRSLEDLSQEILNALPSLTPDQLALYHKDLARRKYANEQMTELYGLRANLPIVFAYLKQEDDRSKQLKFAELLWTSSLALLSGCTGLPFSSVDLARDFYLDTESLSTSDRMAAIGTFVLCDADYEAWRIYDNVRTVLDDIRNQRQAPVPPEGEIVSIEHFGQGDLTNGPVHYNKWVSFLYRDVFAEVTIKNTGTLQSDYEIFYSYLDSQTTFTLIPKLAERSYPISTTGKSDTVVIDPGETHTFVIWFKREGEGIDPKGQDIDLYLFGHKKKIGDYCLDTACTRFGTTKIVTNGVSVSDSELALAPMANYPVRSEMNHLFYNNYVLRIFLENPFAFPVHCTLDQTIPVGDQVISIGGANGNQTASWEVDLESREERTLQVTFKCSAPSGELLSVPSARLRIYDRVNDRWLEFCSNSLMFKIPTCSCKGAAILPYGYQVIDQRLVGDTDTEYDLRLNAMNFGTWEIREVSVQLASRSANAVVLDGKVRFGSIQAGRQALSEDLARIRTNMDVAAMVSQLVWQVEGCTEPNRSDLNHDWRVDFADLVRLSENWLKQGSGLSEDLHPDGSIDARDLSILGEEWSGGSR